MIAAAGEARQLGEASGARRLVSGIYPGFEEDLLILAARREKGPPSRLIRIGEKLTNQIALV